MAPPKPSVQTKFILDAMEEEAEKELTKLDQILDSVDMLFARVTDIGLTQQKMCAQLELNTQAIDLQTTEIEDDGSTDWRSRASHCGIEAAANPSLHATTIRQ